MQALQNDEVVLGSNLCKLRNGTCFVVRSSTGPYFLQALCTKWSWEVLCAGFIRYWEVSCASFVVRGCMPALFEKDDDPHCVGSVAFAFWRWLLQMRASCLVSKNISFLRSLHASSCTIVLFHKRQLL